MNGTGTYWATRGVTFAIGVAWLAFNNWRGAGVGDPGLRRARKAVQRRRRNEGRQR